MAQYACQCSRHRFDSWVRKSLGGGNGNPFQCSCLENPMDRGAWRSIVWGISKSWTWLSNWAMHTHKPKWPRTRWFRGWESSSYRESSFTTELKERNGDLVRKRRDPRTKEQASLPGDGTRTHWVPAEVPGIVLMGSLSVSLPLSHLFIHPLYWWFIICQAFFCMSEIQI